MQTQGKVPIPSWDPLAGVLSSSHMTPARALGCLFGDFHSVSRADLTAILQNRAQRRCPHSSRRSCEETPGRSGFPSNEKDEALAKFDELCTLLAGLGYRRLM
jgi:hypothetical protein